MNKPLLTVIVPCYNVEKYVDKCISSIVNQSYSHLEILLVNDGSTDNTGKICDQWQERDSRIRVFHKQNEGQSYARKTGIENMTAEYAAFVDADDWIDAGMYSGMMTALLSTNSDIAQCDYCNVYEDGRSENQSDERKNGSVEVIEQKQGVLSILDDKKWKSFMWNKIFKKHLFENIEFPKGRVYEEIPVMHILFHHALQSVYIHKVYYFYYNRYGNTVNPNTSQARIKGSLHYAWATYERYLFVKQHPQYHTALPRVKYLAINTGIIFLHHLHIYPNDSNYDYFEDISKQICSIPVNREDNLKRSLKIQLCILRMSPKLYKILRTIFVRITI